MDPDVSRETPSTPEVARRAFPSDRLALAEQYAELLATDGVVRGLIGPREAPRLWDRHLVNCSLLGQLIPEGSTVCDIGSGAGLPGLVLAIARPDLSLTLVEPLLRRTTFLEEVAATLALDNVGVVRGRAEVLHGARTFDVVTSRAVAPLTRLLGWSMPLVAGTGALLAMKGSSVSDEIDAAADELVRWGCAVPEITELGADWPVSPTVALRVAWRDPARVSWPLATSPDQSGSTGQRPAGRGRSTAKRRRRT
jgi:16S rRNA (guanine527-N7)-methyltransferase